MGPLISRGVSYRTLSLVDKPGIHIELCNEEQLKVIIDYSCVSPVEVDNALSIIIMDIELKLNCRLDQSGLRRLFTEALRKSVMQIPRGRNVVEFYIYIREFLYSRGLEPSFRPAPEVKTKDFTEKEKQILLLL